MPNLIKELLANKGVITATMLLVTSSILSQTSTYKFERLSIKDGLSHSNVFVKPAMENYGLAPERD